jgi:uncharacterized membrane protein YozB (DUF420 family)
MRKKTGTKQDRKIRGKQRAIKKPNHKKEKRLVFKAIGRCVAFYPFMLFKRLKREARRHNTPLVCSNLYRFILYKLVHMHTCLYFVALIPLPLALFSSPKQQHIVLYTCTIRKTSLEQKL